MGSEWAQNGLGMGSGRARDGLGTGSEQAQNGLGTDLEQAPNVGLKLRVNRGSRGLGRSALRLSGTRKPLPVSTASEILYHLG